MKTIFFIRHAKSSWDQPGLSDRDRPLNERGLRDAPFMAKMLAGKGFRLDHIVSSPATRAFTTAVYFAKAFGIPQERIEINTDIYEAWPDEILRIVHQLSDEYSAVAIFGHNPTFTTMANHFASRPLDYLPTCGIARVEADITSWKQLNDGNGKLVEVLFPKQFA